MSSREHHLYEFGPFQLNTAEHLLLRDGKPVALTPKAFETLVMLVERSGHLVEKDELIKALWPDSFVEEANLSQHVWMLRKKLGKAEDGRLYIETVPKRGYRFAARVRELTSAGVEGLLVKKSTFTRVVTEEEEETQGLDNAVVRLEREAPLIAASRRGRINASHVLTTSAFLVATASLIWLIFLGGRAPAPKPEMIIERLTNGGIVHSATLSPDGKYFVYEEQDGVTSHLWLRQTGQSNTIEIVPPAQRYTVGTTFSPDERFVYFTTTSQQDPNGALYRVPVLGGPQTKLLADINSPVTFSPDGQQIAFIRFEGDQYHTRLVIASADGGNERVLAMKEGGEFFDARGPSWSPDGKLVANGLFTGPTSANDLFCSIVGVDAQSGAIQPLTAQKWDNCGRIAWAGDGRGFLLVGTKHGESNSVSRDQVWYVSQPLGEPHRITTDLSRYYYESLGLTADASALLVVPFSRTSQIWSMDSSGDSRTATQLTTGSGDGRAGIATLPDGRLVFIRRTGEHVDLWQMNDDGTGQKQLTNDPPFLEELRSTPDGRYLIFASNRDGRSHLFRMDADGSNLKQLTGGGSTETDSDCSPDGSWIVYSSQPALDGKVVQPGLWKISIDGGTPILLTEREAHSPHFSPDGRFISYASLEKDGYWRLEIISADGGAPVRTFETVNNPELSVGCRFTPDGQALTYLVVQKATSNIWLQPIDGSPARPITDFTSGEIYNYLFSRDGTRLFLARGYDIHDVTLVKNFSR